MSVKTIAHELATKARATGYQVGLAFGAQADVCFTVEGYRFGHAAAMSVYSDGVEVARVVWSYVSRDRTRYGAVLSFAGVRDGSKFKRVESLRAVESVLRIA